MIVSFPRITFGVVETVIELDAVPAPHSFSAFAVIVYVPGVL
jgi:hypothetical protein